MITLFKNSSGQGIYFYAFDQDKLRPATGIASTFTVNISKDGASPSPLNSQTPTETYGGTYFYNLTQPETNCNSAVVLPSSTLAYIQCDPVFFTTSALYPDVNLTQSGLNNILASSPTGIAKIFPDKLIQIHDRFFGKHAIETSGSTTGVFTLYNNNGIDYAVLQIIRDNGSYQIFSSGR